ncbi:hypothetical protein H0Z60_19170 [Ectothiorhodospiraceae bacterium WFHF3C12]|nr:hypothetical protein [Ectothiorhodospiraceae bacterium WFHF3C12]
MAYDADLDKVRKTLGEPLLPEFSDYMRRIRTSLVIVSLVSIGAVLGQLEIDPSSSVFGLRFNGLTDDLVKKALFVAELYLLIHFMWGSLDSWLEWTTRLTGTRLSHVTVGTFGGDQGDYPSDPRQSTLYNWWVNEAKQIGNLQAPLNRICDDLATWERRVGESFLDSDLNRRNAVDSIRKTNEKIDELKTKVIQVERTIASKRIPVSLERFDNRFKLMLRSQNLRWFFLELGFPLVLGVAAAAALLTDLFLPHVCIALH